MNAEQRRFGLDTNVLIHAVEAGGADRTQRAERIVRRAVATRRCILTVQNIGEFYADCVRKRHASPSAAAVRAAGFGDLFAFPAPKPGRLYALSLPADVVSYPGFGASFVAGTTRLVTATGATLGPVVISPGAIGAPEVYTSVSGTIDPGTSLGTGPAHLGTLVTHGVIR